MFDLGQWEKQRMEQRRIAHEKEIERIYASTDHEDRNILIIAEKLYKGGYWEEDEDDVDMEPPFIERAASFQMHTINQAINMLNTYKKVKSWI